MNNNLYYTAPSNEIFEDIKQCSIDLWKSKKSHPNYLKQKLDRIEDIQNIKDNALTIFAMFDEINQKILLSKLQQITVEWIKKVIPEHFETYLI